MYNNNNNMCLEENVRLGFYYKVFLFLIIILHIVCPVLTDQYVHWLQF